MMEYSADAVAKLAWIMKQLSEGRDPTSGVLFHDDTILNSKLLKSAFSDVANILSKDAVVPVTRPYRFPFFMTEDEKTQIPLSEEPIPISKFVFIINSNVFRRDMKKLCAKHITAKLTELDYLKIVTPEDGPVYKVPTERGEALGIHPVHKKNSRGDHYVTNMYNRNAQEYIIYEVIPHL